MHSFNWRQTVTLAVGTTISDENAKALATFANSQCTQVGGGPLDKIVFVQNGDKKYFAVFGCFKDNAKNRDENDKYESEMMEFVIEMSDGTQVLMWNFRRYVHQATGD